MSSALDCDRHPPEIDDHEDEEDDLQRTSTKPSLVDKLRSNKGCIYKPVVGDTKLHNAIRCDKKAGIDALMELYREDFEKVRDHLVSKYQWNVEDKIWLRKTVLEASTEEQCQSAKNLENRQVGAEDLRRAVLVLLKYPVEGEEVAVLHPNEASRSAVAKLITTPIPNVFLSWNYVGLEDTRETFIQSAVSKGMHDVVNRLYELGEHSREEASRLFCKACTTDFVHLVQLFLNGNYDLDFNYMVYTTERHYSE